MRAIEVTDPARLAGLPPDFIAAHTPDASGTIRITTDYPDYNPFMTYADDDELRTRALHQVPQPRRSAERGACSATILELRAEKATLLGFADWADYISAPTR